MRKEVALGDWRVFYLLRDVARSSSHKMYINDKIIISLPI